MAFSEEDRVKIRRWLGFARSDPRLDVAVTSAQSQADGGTAPDNSIETSIREDLADLETLRASMKALWSQAQALDADGLKIDVARAMSVLRAEGRRLVGHIADALDTAPQRDVFVGRTIS